MASSKINLPPGFELEEEMSLPPGFVLESNTPSQSGFDLGTALKSSFANAANLGQSFLYQQAGSLVSPFSTDKADAIYKAMEEDIERRNQWANPTGKELSLAEKGVGLLANLPGTIATFPMSPAETGRQALASGESLGTALAAQGIDTVGNVVGSAAGPLGKGIIKPLVTGALLNMSQEYLTKKAIQSTMETEKGKALFAPQADDVILSGIAGGAFGAYRGRVEAKKPTKPSPGSKADLALAKAAAKEQKAKVDPEIEAQVAKMHDASILEKLQKLDQDLTTQERRAASEGTVRTADETLYSDLEGILRNKQQLDESELAKDRQTEAMDVALDTNTLRPDGEPLNLLQTEQLRAANEGPQLQSREELRQVQQNIETARQNFIAEFERTRTQPTERGEAGLRPMGFGNKGSREGVGTAPKMQGLTGAGWRRKQGGGIDPEVFAEGYKKFTSALSRLSDTLANDDGWKKLIVSRLGGEYQTNSDGTPLLMLHTTLRNFRNLKANEQGVHLGFPASSLRFGLKGDDLFPTSRTGKENANTHPVVIKKGNYPFIDFDIGYFSPERIVGSEMYPDNPFKQYISSELSKKGYTEAQIDGFYKYVLNQDTIKQSNLAFMDVLKRAGIDGFFYTNRVESPKRAYSVHRTGRSNSPEKIRELSITALKMFKDPVSFVTWDESKIANIFDVGPDYSSPKVPFNYKKQGGGILFDFGKKKEAEAALKNNKYLKDVLPELTTVADTPEGVLELTKASKDFDRGLLGDAIGNFTKGMFYEKFKTNHPLVKYAFDRVSEAVDAAQYRFDNLVNKDLAPALRNLSKNERAELGELMLAEMKAKKDLPTSVLKESGFTDAQIAVHQKIRDLHKNNLDTLNKARELAGKEPIDAYTAYLTGLASGNFRKVIYKWATKEDGSFRLDDEGNKIPEVVGVVGSDLRGLMNKRVEALLANNPEWMAGPEKYTGMRRGGSGEASMKALTGAMAIVSDNNPNFKAFSQAMQEVLQSDVYDAMGAKKHTMSKKGVVGMSGDKPWMDSYENAVDLFNAQIRYTETMGRWAEMSKVMDDLAVILKDKDVQEKHPNAVKMVTDYTSAAMGYNPSAVGKALDNLLGAIGSWAGVGPNVVNKTSHAMRETLNTMFFTLNHAWMAVNLAQPLLVAPEMKAFLNSRGVEVSLDPSGWSDIAAKGSWSSLKHLAGWPETSFEKSMWKYAKEHGIDQTQLIATSSAVERSPAFMLNKALKFGANSVEAKPRSAMFATFAHMLKDAGYVMDKDLFKVARELTDMAMTDYRHHEQMPILQALGPGQHLAANLTSFKQNTISRWATFAREMGNDNYRAFLTAGMAAMAWAGLMGLPGYEELSAMVEFFSKKLGKPTTLDKLVLDMADKVNSQVDGLGDAIAMGSAGYVGLDLHNRIGMPQAMPTLTGGAGKFVDIYDAAETYAKKPNEWNAKQLARQANPIPPLNIWMDNTWFTATNEQGQDLALNKRGQGSIIRNDKDKLFKKWGFTGSNETRLKGQEYARDVQDRFYTDRQRRVREQVLEVIAANKGRLPEAQANALAEEYIKYQGNPANWDNVVKDAKTAYNTTKSQRRFIKNTGNTPGSAEKLKRAVE